MNTHNTLYYKYSKLFNETVSRDSITFYKIIMESISVMFLEPKNKISTVFLPQKVESAEFFYRHTAVYKKELFCHVL